MSNFRRLAEGKGVFTMIPYKAIIVDDDVVITRRIKQLIEQNGEFKVVAEANSAHSFLQLFPLQNYDLVILDIDLPDGSGIELAKWIRKSDQRVPLLFITGYADYGVESYQVEATDYILKPIRPEFVQLALDKVKRHLNQVDSSLQLIKKNTDFARKNFSQARSRTRIFRNRYHHFDSKRRKKDGPSYP
jgi:two-component SAPR family response regulator